MNIPTNLLYSKSHEWVRFEDDTTAVIGLTDYAQESLGGLVFVNLPLEGDTVTVGDTFGDAESVKAVSDIYSPVTGTIAAVNEELLDAPESINEAPYEAWLIKVTEITNRETLLDADAYEAHIHGSL